ncbi:hypothetical protein [Paraburkholderia madseniana]|uniref:hypothetical protein n=1 Tax=Paraburkholderia madseniana TaxID=2599607 RepID=UPI001F2E6DEC|nr:hypothetical protein [Paraburkholderia madseniana]
MARTDLAVLAGVGILALACLVVYGIYLYWSSDSYRDRKRQLEPQIGSAHAIQKNEKQFSGTEATMGTQLSHRCKTSLYRGMSATRRTKVSCF